MKTVKKHRWMYGRGRGPVVAHVLELVVGVVIVAGGQGLFAGIVGADPDIAPPTVPANLRLDGRSATSIDIDWDASTDNVAVTGYHVYRNGSLVGSPSGTSFSDSGLAPNAGYTYTVSAYDTTPNESAQSSGLPVTTLADTSAPSIPGNMHQTGSTTSTISLAWNASSDNVGATSYEIYRNGSLIRTQAGTTFTDTGLSIYTTYTYMLTARDAAGNISQGSPAFYGSTAPDVTAPSVPDNLHQTGSTITTISLAWNASTDDIGVSSYHVYRDGALVGSPAGPSFTDTGIEVSSTYTYTVSAVDTATNQSAQSAPFLTESSNDTTPPTMPTNVHTTSVLDNAIHLAWDASTDDVSVTGYKIYRDGSLVGTSTTTSFSNAGLAPVTDYDYIVKAYDAASNDSPASPVLNTQTAYDTTNPSVPDNLAATNKTDTTITLGWDAASDNIGVAGYDIYRDGTLITTTVGTHYVDSGLGADTSYTYRVRAHDGSGNNSAQFSQLVTRTLEDLINPAAPTGLVLGSQTTTSVALSWNPATDDVAVTAYKLYRDGSLVTQLTATDYTDGGRQYNHSYDYTVTALDAAGNESPESAVLPISTLPDITAPSVSLTTPGDGETKQLTFGIAAAASDDLDLAQVEFYINASLIAVMTAPPFSFNWDSYAVHNGNQLVTVKAVDASGNITTQAITLNISNPPPPLTGNLNGDHRINIYDLSILLAHWRKGGAGDFNNNGKVDIFDLSVLLARFGQDNSNYY